MSLPSSDFEEVGFDDGLSFDSSEAYPNNAGDVTTDDGPVVPKYRKQEFSVYSVMLILSFIFLLVSLILLFMEVDRLSS